MKATKQPKAGRARVKRMIFRAYRLLHTLSTRCPQLIHNRAARDASRGHFSISGAAESRWTAARFDLSNRNDGRVSMMRAGRSKK
jgi:hypothetical protein